MRTSWKKAVLQRSAPEGGSIVLAMLAAIVVMGLITVVVASTMTGQRAVRFDQEFTGALHVAEAGLEEVVFQLNDRQIQDGDSLATGDGIIGDGAYEWTAEQIDDHEWRVISTVTDGDVTRTIQAVVEDQPLFNLAAFSDNLINLGGTNHADSYHSGWDGDVVDLNLQDWCTGKGRVGSNDSLEFQGSGSGQATCAYERSDQTVDGVDLYDWPANPDPGRCEHNGGTNCEFNGEPQYETHEDRVEFNDRIEWMEELLEDCTALPERRASDFGGLIPPATATDSNVVQLSEDGPYAYCAQSLRFDVHTSLDGATPNDPVVFLVEEWVEASLDSGNRLRVNCDACTASSLNPADEDIYPLSAALQIYTPSADGNSPDSGDVIGIRQHSRFAGVVYAPRGTCGGTGNAQVHIFGALVCWDIPGVGGWNFHYDEALADQIRTGHFVVSRWSEQ